MHFLSSLVYIPTTTGILIIALVTLVRRQGPGTVYFSGLSFTAAIWLLLQYLAQLIGENNPSIGLHLIQGASLVSNGLVYAFLLFVLNFIDIDTRRFKLIKLLALLPPLCFAALSYSSYMIQSATISSYGIAIEEAGGLYILQLISFALYLLIGLALLFVSTIRKQAHLRTPSYLLLIALGQAVFFIMLASTILATSARSQLIIPVSIFAMVTVVSLAIIRHRLFDIRPIIARAIAYILLAATLGGSFSVVIFLVTNVILGKSPSGLATGVYIIAALILAFAFQPLKRVFDRITNKFFYQDAYDPRDVLDRLGALLAKSVEIRVIEKETRSILESTLHSSFASFLLSFDASREDKKLLDYLLRSNLTVAAADELNRQHHDFLQSELRKRDIALAVRLRTVHEDLGFLLLGHRRSGVIYSGSDQRLLGAVADELAVGLQNALRFEEIERFNLTLQQKVDEATKKLRQTNERLRLLDQTKDDFISMASHQLRTPLTSVKGYVSMVLDGDAGKITGLQRKLLNQSFISSQRMVYLISDLLNVSRLRTGKFVIEPVPTNLAKVVQEEVEQLVETVKGRNLELTYHRPEHFPTLMLDETKLRQVIMNFVDNAIYYTPSGGHINIYLVDKPQSIEFTVVDDGIGVPRHEQHHLFTKFFRAHNARRARPDGTGLGIFMAKKVVIAQGGAIIFKSQEGKGSTFGFTIVKNKLLPVPTTEKR